MSRPSLFLASSIFAFLALAAAPSNASTCVEDHDHSLHTQTRGFTQNDFDSRQDWNINARGRGRDERRGYDGFRGDRCFRFALRQYKTMYSGGYALDRAKRFCRDDFSFRVFKTAFKTYSNYGTYYRLDRAKRFAQENPNLGVRDELFRFTLGKMQRFYSGSYALDRSAQMVKRFPAARNGCVQEVFGEYQQSYSAHYALERSFKFCSDDSPRRRNKRRGRGNRHSRRGW